jgi:hydroxymethylglutaryl-CoA lyase
MAKIKIIECPRDAMQGIQEWIPTETKLGYLRSLAKVGFDSIDFGSFVSAKAIPQLKDTPELIGSLTIEEKGRSKLLAIIANTRGVEESLNFPLIDYVGFPLSLSETFQLRNTNKSIAEAFQVVSQTQILLEQGPCQQVVYLSMGFGNPYADPWEEGYIFDFVEKLMRLDVRVISLADTIGIADPDKINFIFSKLIPAFPDIEFGAHFHSRPESSFEKLEAAWDAGCQRFDGAIRGFGGCPMAEDDLVGNIDTLKILRFAKMKGALSPFFDELAFQKAVELSGSIF